MDWEAIFKSIEDDLLPHYECDVWERGLYMFLLRHTRLAGVKTATIPLPMIAQGIRCSEWQARKIIRSLAAKGCIDLEQTRKGHLVSVYIPSELQIPRIEIGKRKSNLDEIDFFQGRAYVSALLAREQERCFYCLSEISEGSAELDHVIPQVAGGGNSYRNIVASCHRCNTRKQGAAAEDHLRALFRSSQLSEGEFESRLEALEALKDGKLKPSVENAQ